MGKYLSAPKTPVITQGTPTGTPTATPTLPAEAPASPADWKTYTNAPYKFSFNYPSSWTLSERTDINENMLIVDLSGEGFFSPGQYQANNLLVRVLPAKKQPTGKICFPREPSPECYSISQAQSTTVDDVSGYQVDYFIPVPGGTSKTDKVRLIFVENRGYIYSVSQQRIVFRENDFRSIFDQILSTFRFLK